MNKLDTLKCVEVTSQTQADNGTVCYFDPQTGAYYTLHENGYVRRKDKEGRHYQVNPTKQKVYEFNRHDGQMYSFTGKSRVMLHTHEERINAVSRAVVNFRKYKSK